MYMTSFLQLWNNCRFMNVNFVRMSIARFGVGAIVMSCGKQSWCEAWMPRKVLQWTCLTWTCGSLWTSLAGLNGSITQQKQRSCETGSTVGSVALRQLVCNFSVWLTRNTVEERLPCCRLYPTQSTTLYASAHSGTSFPFLAVDVCLFLLTWGIH